MDGPTPETPAKQEIVPTDPALTGKPSQITLTDFINENYRILSALGVFTAATVFSANLSLPPFNSWLSFMLMAATVFLWLELVGKFPSGRGSQLLVWFENILTLTTIFLILYWLVAYRSEWRGLLPIPVGLVLLWVIGSLIRRSRLFDRISSVKPRAGKVLRWLTWVTVIVLVLFGAWVISYYVNSLFDAVYKGLQPTATASPTVNTQATRDVTGVVSPAGSPIPTQAIPVPTMSTSSRSPEIPQETHTPASGTVTPTQ
jgi:hypothetical protein